MNPALAPSADDFGAPIIYADQPVITLAMMDDFHGRPAGTARRNFNEHRRQLRETIHFFELIGQPDEIRSLGLARPDGSTPNKLILLTERGYSMLVRCFRDRKAWEVQDRLVESYFGGASSQLAPAAPAAPALPPEVLAALDRVAHLENRVEAMHATVGEIIRPAHIRDQVRATHREIVVEMDGGRCPCCGEAQVVERLRVFSGATFAPEWTGGYCISRFRGVHLARLRDTWPVCRGCRYRLFSAAFHRDASPNFERYQRASVDGWMRKRRPDLFGGA